MPDDANICAIPYMNFSGGLIGIEVGGSQLEGWTKRVGFVATFGLLVRENPH